MPCRLGYGMSQTFDVAHFGNNDRTRLATQKLCCGLRTDGCANC